MVGCIGASYRRYEDAFDVLWRNNHLRAHNNRRNRALNCTFGSKQWRSPINRWWDSKLPVVPPREENIGRQETIATTGHICANPFAQIDNIATHSQMTTRCSESLQNHSKHVPNASLIDLERSQKNPKFAIFSVQNPTSSPPPEAARACPQGCPDHENRLQRPPRTPKRPPDAQNRAKTTPNTSQNHPRSIWGDP